MVGTLTTMVIVGTVSGISEYVLRTLGDEETAKIIRQIGFSTLGAIGIGLAIRIIKIMSI